MITINKELCIGCTSCVKDCFPKSIEMVEGKAQFINHNCMLCGHCVAVCPRNAISIESYDMNEVLEFNNINQTINSQNYLNHLKARHTIRQFKDEKINDKDLQMILEAGKYSPSGGNRQTVAYTVIQKDLPNFKQMVMEKLYQIGLEAQKTGKKESWYSDLYIRMYDDYINKNIDQLYFDASTIIVVSSDSMQAACIASAHMETMVYSLGLGMLYSGFSTRAITNSPELKQYLNLKPNYNVYTVLVIGKPKVKYFRTVPRKQLDVEYK